MKKPILGIDIFKERKLTVFGKCLISIENQELFYEVTDSGV
jgi:hypothetical protein